MAIAGIVLGWVGMATLLPAELMGIYVWHEDRNHDSAPERVRAAVYIGEWMTSRRPRQEQMPERECPFRRRAIRVLL